MPTLFDAQVLATLRDSPKSAAEVDAKFGWSVTLARVVLDSLVADLKAVRSYRGGPSYDTEYKLMAVEPSVSVPTEEIPNRA